MSNGMNRIDKVILKISHRKGSQWFDLERSLIKLPSSCGDTDMSPEKTLPDSDKIPFGGKVPFSITNFFLVGKYLNIIYPSGRKGNTVIGSESLYAKVNDCLGRTIF
jgi:hypothetical protein